MRKKLLAMLLCLTMLLSVFPATAFADEPDPVNEDVEAVVEETETATPEDMTAEHPAGRLLPIPEFRVSTDIVSIRFTEHRNSITVSIWQLREEVPFLPLMTVWLWLQHTMQVWATMS